MEETDSEYTSYWRDWVGTISSFSLSTVVISSQVLGACMDGILIFITQFLTLLMDQAFVFLASAC